MSIFTKGAAPSSKNDLLNDQSSLTTPIKKSLEQMAELKKILHRKRMANGAIGFHDFEQIFTTKDGEISVKIRNRNFAEEMIEEFMLQANKATAYMLQKFRHGLYRVHDIPSAEKMVHFFNHLKIFKKKLPKKGYENPLKKKGPNKYHLFLQSLLKHEEKLCFSKLLLISQSKACYSKKCSGHYGLGFTHYTHFTSPIRRYPDLMVHRLLKESISIKNFQKPKRNRKSIFKPTQKRYSTKELDGICMQTSLKERKAIDAEREWQKLKSVRFLQQEHKKEPSKKYEGYIEGISPRGNVFVRDLTTGVEGMIDHRFLDNGTLFYDREKMAMVNQKNEVVLTIGANVEYTIYKIRVEDLFIEFRPLTHE